MEIIIDDKLPKTLDDMSATLNKVKATKPTPCWFPDTPKGAATGARQIEQFKVDVPMVAMTHCDSAQIEQKVPTGAEYTLCARQWQRQLSYKDDDGVFGDGEDFSVFSKRHMITNRRIRPPNRRRRCKCGRMFSNAPNLLTPQYCATPLPPLKCKPFTAISALTKPDKTSPNRW